MERGRRQGRGAGRGEGPLPIDPDLDPADVSEPSASHRPVAREGPVPRRRTPSVLAAIALGGVFGALARHAVAEQVGPSADGFPWATFWTNVTGSLALGFVLVAVLHRFPSSRYLRPFVATGFLGSFTTFSTFVVEIDLLVDNGHLDLAAAYVTSSLVVGLAATALGMAGGRLVPVVGPTR